MSLPARSPIDLGSRRELFIDDFLIAEQRGTTLRLQTPWPAPLSAGAFADAGYATVIAENAGAEGCGPRCHAWYRAYAPGYPLTAESTYDGNPGEYTAYMHSPDGVNWTRPSLGLYDLGGSRENNAVLAGLPPFSHNFSPMLDTRPGVNPAQRFKALAGVHHSGLHAFASPDGLRWRPLSAEAVVKSEPFAFDSQNVSFWSPAESCYVCYHRSWLFAREGQFEGALRSISRRTSPDFLHWSAELPLRPNLPGEHLYTSQTAPYFRAPHLYIALPTRFLPERGESTDILLMTSRPCQRGPGFTRAFREAFIRPGPDPARWGNRSNYAALNLLPTGPGEMSLYLSSNSVKEAGRRLVLRTDGFASLHAGWEGGEMRTHPLTFSGSRLELNYAASAAGSLQVELQTPAGEPLPGYSLAECPAIVGDQVARLVCWQGGEDLSSLAGRPLRLRFVLRDADLYSLCFTNPS